MASGACGEGGYDGPLQKFVHMNSHTHVNKPFPLFIGVAGGTASGKSSVCNKIVEQLTVESVNNTVNRHRVVVINQDSFYRNLVNDDERMLAQRGEFNFDHPDAFDFDLMQEVMTDLKSGKSVQIPEYNYRTNSREVEGREILPADVILIEGILVFYHQQIREMFSMKLFVDTDPDTRLSRRVLRDINERGRNLEKILHQYISLVKPAFEEFCLPTKKYADVIIPRGADNTVAIDLIVQHIIEITRPNSTNKRVRHSSETFVGRPH